jgi:hypothetical protein
MKKTAKYYEVFHLFVVVAGVIVVPLSIDFLVSSFTSKGYFGQFMDAFRTFYTVS